MENLSGLGRLAKQAFIAWLVLFLIAICVFVYVIFVQGELFNTTSTPLALTFLAAFGLGTLSFLFSIFFYTLNEQIKGNKKVNWLLAILKTVIILPIFPLYFIIKTVYSYKRNKPAFLDSRHALIVGTLAIVLPFWLLGYLLLYMGTTRIAGLRYYVSTIDTGDSMSPTIPKGNLFKLYPYKNIAYSLNSDFAYQFQHGDIVSFSNQTTKDLIRKNGLSDYNFVKRIIALPNDTIEFRGGVVFLNGEPLDEPYTLTPNSTYSYDAEFQGEVYGNFLKECQPLTIPDKKMFVLADNREHGDDSRYIGLVDFEDVEAYLPLKDQKEGYYEGVNLIQHSQNWRAENTTITEDIVFQANESCSR